MRSTQDSSVGSTMHFRYRSIFLCQRRARYPTVWETKMSMCPLSISFFLFCFSIPVTVLSVSFGFHVVPGFWYWQLVFTTTCWVLEGLSLSICYLIFQCEVFLDVVATGSAAGIGALVACMTNNPCVEKKKVWMKKYNDESWITHNATDLAALGLTTNWFIVSYLSNCQNVRNNGSLISYKSSHF